MAIWRFVFIVPIDIFSDCLAHKLVFAFNSLVPAKRTHIGCHFVSKVYEFFSTVIWFLHYFKKLAVSDGGENSS